jgi:hypothetical protein
MLRSYLHGMILGLSESPWIYLSSHAVHEVEPYVWHWQRNFLHVIGKYFTVHATHEVQPYIWHVTVGLSEGF